LIDFWLNSIYIHTYDKDRRDSSSVLLIGTRKDLVSDVHRHWEISNRLYERFSQYQIIMNETARGCNPLLFFLVDNKKGMVVDVTFNYGMRSIEDALQRSEEVNQLVPLTWLRAVDILSSPTNRSKLALESAFVHSIFEGCAIPASDYEDVLLFLHNAGILIWINEPNIRNAIILDPIAFFVDPVTTLICKLKPTENSETFHTYSEVHRYCQTHYHFEWMQMEKKGESV
jgi:hypothetical protein